MSFKIGDKVKIKESTSDSDFYINAIHPRQVQLYLRNEILEIENVFGDDYSIEDKNKNCWIVPEKFLELIK